MLLTEIYKKRVNKMISEEYGISNTLHYDIIPRFLSQLKSEIKNTDFDTNYKVSCKNGKFSFNCKDKNNTEFKVFWIVYYFDNMQEYQTFRSQHALHNYIMYDFKMIKITVVYVNGKPLNNDFYDSIGHEFEHTYQNVLMGKTYGNKLIYSVAISNINSKNQYERSLAHIIYASTKSEQDGMINGFYSEFINGNINPDYLDKAIENSECGWWIKNLYTAYIFLKQHNDMEMQNAISKYKKLKDYYNYKYFLYIARNGIKSFERRIARLTYKIKQDIYNNSKPTLNENFDVLNDYYLIKYTNTNGNK